ncbi:hypothetical protein TYRP_020143 [Tyrophagus putrescentiae]|nr:hypothetical protein TYRP_020143 [Tyrophagus putrescentiae]
MTLCGANGYLSQSASSNAPAHKSTKRFVQTFIVASVTFHNQHGHWTKKRTNKQTAIVGERNLSDDSTFSVPMDDKSLTGSSPGSGNRRRDENLQGHPSYGTDTRMQLR